MTKSTTLKPLTFSVPREAEGARIDQFLVDSLSHARGTEISRALVRRLLQAGAVYLNSRQVRIASKELRAGASVQVFFDVDRVNEAPAQREKTAPRVELNRDAILFRDADLVVVDKPAGLPTQASVDRSRDHLYAAVIRYLAKETGVASPYVGLHHRLDRDTSGVVAFTASKRANAPLAEQFREHQIKKTYEALVSLNKPLQAGREWIVKNYLKKEAQSSKRSKMVATRSGGDVAETSFRALKVWGEFALIEAKPKTGRMHQIRVHLADEGFPILGDETYGGRLEVGREKVARVMLHARRLELKHPTKETDLEIESPVPSDFKAWIKRLNVNS